MKEVWSKAYLSAVRITDSNGVLRYTKAWVSNAYGNELEKYKYLPGIAIFGSITMKIWDKIQFDLVIPK